MSTSSNYKTTSLTTSDRRRAIAYSMDALVPGLYLWFGPVHLRIGGAQPEERYPGVVHSNAGIALVLPGYRIWSTYQGSYDPR
jgi:hypothetical protein